MYKKEPGCKMKKQMYSFLKLKNKIMNKMSFNWIEKCKFLYLLLPRCKDR